MSETNLTEQRPRTTTTPGPWRADGESFGHTIRGANQLGVAWVPDAGFVSSPEGAFILDLDQARANAHLIAAAPDLLEALKFILEHSGDPVMENMARRAIAKAEGR